MTSIKLMVTGAEARVSVTGPLTSGMVGIPVTIEYDGAWDGLTKNLMCRCSVRISDSGEIRSILNVGETATIAHEVMQSNMHLHLGIEGFSADGKLVIPTLWAYCGKIGYGANTCDDPSTDPELSVWNQLQTEMEQLKEDMLTQEQIADVQAYAQEARQAAEEAKQAAASGSGGYYTPGVEQTGDDIVVFTFAASQEGMPVVPPVGVLLPGSGNDPEENVAQEYCLLKSPDGTEWKLTVSNTGNVTATRADGETVTFVLPVVRLTGDVTDITADRYVDVICHYLDETEGVEFTDYAKIAYQGSGSLAYTNVEDGVDKAKNYKIKLFTDEARETKSKRTFRDWHATNNYHIKANFPDRTNFMNNMMMHFLAKTYQYLDPLPRDGARYTLDGFAVLLYINDVFCGIRFWNLKQDDKIYSLNEEEADENGNVTQQADLCYQIGRNNGTNSGDNSGAFVYGNLSEGSAAEHNFADAHAEIDYYWEDRVWDKTENHPDIVYNSVKWVSEASDAEFRANLHKYFDVPYLINYFVMMYTCGMIDSKGKNCGWLYFPELARLFLIFYDMDNAFGTYYGGATTGYATDLDLYGCPSSRLFDKLWRNFRAEIVAKYWELRETVLTVEQVEDSINAVWGHIPAEWIEANKTAKYDGTTYYFDPDGAASVLEWAANRFEWMDKRMVESDEELDWTTVPSTSIILSASELVFDDAGEQTLTATVEPSNTTDITLWTSSNHKVARVVDGKVVAIGNGTAVITATSGDQIASCTVTVEGIGEIKPVYSLPEATTFDGTSTVIDTGVKLFDEAKDWTILMEADLTQALGGLRTAFWCYPADASAPGVKLTRSTTVTDGTTGNYSVGGKAVGGDNYRSVPASATRLAIRCSGGSVDKIAYLYGGEVSDTVIDGPAHVAHDTSLILGCGLSTEGARVNFWRGTMNRFDVYDAALSDAEITAFLDA